MQVNKTQNADSRLAPRITLRVGVTGHRPNKLDLKQQESVNVKSKIILETMLTAINELHKSDQDIFSNRKPDLRLVTSLAEGADTIVAKAAQELGFRFDVVLPFPKAAYGHAQKFSDEAQSTFDTLLPMAHSVLELDGDLTNTQSTRTGYLAAGRRVVAYSDILIAIWDGRREDGVGGTAQILREAIKNGINVIWIRPEGDACIVAGEENLSNFLDNTLIGEDGDSQSKVIMTLVNDLLAPPGANTRGGLNLRQFLNEDIRQGSTWIYFDLMKNILLKQTFRRKLDYSIDNESKNSWKSFQERARVIGGAQFADALNQTLATRWLKADNLALHYSHVYRSTYILNFVLAAFAVLFGLLSVFWWNLEGSILKNSVVVKAIFVLIEASLIVCIIKLTARGNQTEEDWHKRWLEARSTAEILRAARLLALVGSTAAPKDQIWEEETVSWVSWYTRTTLREIGPPSGHLNNEALKIALASALDDEINGQIEYNENASSTWHNIDHKLHIWGERLFKATLVVAVAYLCFAISYTLCKVIGFKAGFEFFSGSKDLVKGLVTVAGAGLPAFGAALFGIRATGDFRLASEQSNRTVKQLKLIRSQLEIELSKDTITRELSAKILYQLTQTLVSDLHEWSKIYSARELQLPG